MDAYTYRITGMLEYDEEVANQFWEALEAKGEQYELPMLNLELDEDKLKEKYPILWEKFGDCPLT